MAMKRKNSQDTGPKVTVLMPAYNCERFLPAAVDSILGQTFGDFEFICIDDGSSDSTAEILSRYAASDNRITVLENSGNLGIVSSLNRGLDASRGEYIARMDADDISLPDRLQKQVLAMDEHPQVSVLGGAVGYIDSAGTDLGVVRRCGPGKSLLARTPLLHPTVMIRRSLLETHGIRYREDFRYAEDYYLWLQLSRVGKMEALDDVVLKYRVTADATRFKHLKGTLWSTLKVKKSGVFDLGIRPGPGDVARFAIEGMLLLLPTPLVTKLYLKLNFDREVSMQA
jgi:glycosyltransferase involved in cell wall biosynthesis